VVSIADMSPGIVNFYFETKAALLLSALESLAVEFEERVLAPVADARARPVAALELLIALYLDADIASPRKISVWYSFWGEASSRREYHEICGKRDVAFADLVRDLVERLIAQSASAHLDADAVALGLIGALEIMWQDIAFQNEADVDREGAKRRCRAYLRSVFPRQFGGSARAAGAPPAADGPPAASAYADAAIFEAERRALFLGQWQWVAHAADFAGAGAYVAAMLAGEPVLAVRDAAGSVRLFRNACARRPHAVAAAPAGHCGGMIVCPADGWRYALDGTAGDAGHAGLTGLPLLLAGELLFTHIMPGAGDAPVPAPGDALPLQGLVPFGPWQRRACLADWKLVVEHWTDVYCATGQNGRTAGLGAGQAGRTETPAGLVWRLALGGEGSGWSGVRYARLLGAGGQHWVRHMLWPNLFIETRPDGATIRQVLPVSAGRCDIRVRHYARQDGGRQARALAVLARRLSRTWEAEDDAVTASTQCGMTAPSQSVSAAQGMQHSAFWRWWRERLG
jgi:TetR/AcrR family transcriptional repressor of bet genes